MNDVTVTHSHRRTAEELKNMGITGPGTVVRGRLKFETKMDVEHYREWLNVVQVWRHE